jgi:integrase
MKQRFILFRRNGVFYCEDTTTGKQTSLRTRDESEANTLLHTRNEAVRSSAMNLQIAQVYLRHSDSALSARTWQHVMDEMTPLKTGPTQTRWKAAILDHAFDTIRNRKLIETTGEHFFEALRNGTVSTNVFLRRLHNFAIGMHWLPWPVLPRLQWPTVKHKERRAITFAEHTQILNREFNPEIKAYYQMLWHLGGAQTDVAELKAEDVDWQARTIAFSRNKTGVPVVITFGPEAASILRSLPQTGYLFPGLARIKHNHRAKMFIKRLKTVGLKGSGISLHSYRYAWAERAKVVGMPERYAQQALGHNSKAFARAYSKNAKVVVPSLEEYESKIVQLPMAVNQ